MMRLAATTVALLGCLVLSSCRSNPRTDNNIRRLFSPLLVQEDDVLKVSLREVRHKRDNLRIWITIKNKTDKRLTMRYGDFIAINGPSELDGALRIPFARVTKSFPLEGGAIKTVSRPIEFTGVPELALSTTIEIRNIRVEGSDETRKFVFDVPIRE